MAIKTRLEILFDRINGGDDADAASEAMDIADELLGALKLTYKTLTKANTRVCGEAYALASNAARAAIARAEGRRRD